MINRIICFILFIILTSINSYAQSVKVKASYKYLLYLPKNYSKQKEKFPLVIYLHGGSQRGNDLNKLKTYGLPGLVDKGHNYKFIIASPQCPENKTWTTENWFDYLYQDLLMKYNIDTNRIYVTGISIGGFGTYEVAMDNPDKFAALVALCGGCNDSTKICLLKNIPVWAFHGTADSLISINETETVVRQLKKCNGNIKFTRLQNKGHALQYLYEDETIYKWMLQQKKTN